MPALRLFVATPAPEAVSEAATVMIDRLRPFGDVRWATPERLHLTLKFLGSTPEEKLSSVQEELERIANNCLQFAVRLDGIGAFPSTRRPQTIWYGLGVDVTGLTDLAAKIDSAMEPLGFERERRPYRPHLTLGRVRSPRGLRELAAELEKCAAKASEPSNSIEWRIDAIALMRSDLKPTGPIYTELSHFFLAKALPASEGEQERRAGEQ